MIATAVYSLHFVHSKTKNEVYLPIISVVLTGNVRNLPIPKKQSFSSVEIREKVMLIPRGPLNQAEAP